MLAYGLLSWDRSYSTADDLRAMMAEKRDLWPAFVNGILDKLSEKLKADGKIMKTGRGLV